MKNTIRIALLTLLVLAPRTARAQDGTTTETTTVTETTTTTEAPPVESTTVDTEVAASADTTEPAEPPPSSTVSPPTFLISIRGGAFIPQVFNRLDASFTAGLGVGYVLPFLDYRVAVVVDAFYTRPERSQSMLADPRLTAASYSYTMVQNDISMFVGFLVHFTDLARDTFVPYAGLGARIHFLWSEIYGTSGTAALGNHTETSTQGGGAIRVGCGVRVGPGLIALDVELGLAPLDHIVTGGANIGNLGVAAGYTIVL